MGVTTAAEIAEKIGLFGAGVYLLSYALLQLGYLRGQSYSYATLNIIAAGSVLISLATAFNMSSVVIQVSWIVISLVGMTRLFVMTKMVRFNAEEQAFVDQHMPLLPKHLAKRFLGAGHWTDIAAGTKLTTEGAVTGKLIYIASGLISVDLGGHEVGRSGPGGFIGELTFFNGEPATATATAAKPSRVLVLDNQRLDRILSRNSEIRAALISSFSTDIRGKLLQRNSDHVENMRAAK